MAVCAVGIESTVVNIRTGIAYYLRPGSITKEQLDRVALAQGFQPFVYASGKVVRTMRRFHPA